MTRVMSEADYASHQAKHRHAAQMKIREQRGGLADSMATVAEIAPTKEAVTAHVAAAWGWIDVTPDKVRVEKYGEGVDSRNGWDTHIVLIEGIGPFGFTDGPLKNGDY